MIPPNISTTKTCDSGRVHGGGVCPARVARGATIQLVVEGVSKRFGGVVAVAGRLARRAARQHRLHHRPERRRQDLAAQHDLGLLQARHRPRRRSRAATSPSKKPSEIAALGVARTFQNIALFSGLTVLDNLMLGRHVRMSSGVLASVIYWGLAQSEEIAPPRGLRGDHRVPEAAGSAQAADRGAGLRPAQARRARPRAGARAQGAAARRADGRHEPGREGGHGALRPRREPGARRHRRPDRARHGRGHGHLRPRRRARPRPRDRRGHAGRGAARSRRSSQAYLGTSKSGAERMSLVDGSATDTLPKLLQRNAERRSRRAPACARRTAASGRPTPGADYRDHVRDFALGLAALGFERGDKLSVVGDNRPRSTAPSSRRRRWAALPCRSTRIRSPRELVYVLNHAEISVIVAEDQEQVDKVLSLQGPAAEACAGRLRRSARPVRPTTIRSCSPSPSVLEAGRDVRQAQPGLLRARAGQGRGRRHRR